MRLRNLLFAVLIAGLGVFVVAGQDGFHSIVRHDLYPNNPYEIVEWRIDDKPIRDISHFTAPPDWWQHVSLTVKNISQKTISKQAFYLTIPPTGKMKTAVGMTPQTDNQEALVDRAGAPTGKFGFRWHPGQTLEFRVKDQETAMWDMHLKGYDVTNVDRLFLDVSFVYFEDSTQWSFGKESTSRAGQSSDPLKKLIRLRAGMGVAPIEVVSTTVNGRTISLGEAFPGRSDWLAGMTVHFKNVSTKTITCARYSLVVLDSHPTGPPNSSWLTFGPPYCKPDVGQSMALTPGSAGEAAFAGGDYERFKERLELTEAVDTRTTAELYLYDVYFADGRKWTNGFGYQRPDPDDPKRWIPDPDTLLPKN